MEVSGRCLKAHLRLRCFMKKNILSLTFKKILMKNFISFLLRKLKLILCSPWKLNSKTNLNPCYWKVVDLLWKLHKCKRNAAVLFCGTSRCYHVRSSLNELQSVSIKNTKSFFVLQVKLRHLLQASLKIFFVTQKDYTKRDRKKFPTLFLSLSEFWFYYKNFCLFGTNWKIARTHLMKLICDFARDIKKFHCYRKVKFGDTFIGPLFAFDSSQFQFKEEKFCSNGSLEFQLEASRTS